MLHKRYKHRCIHFHVLIQPYSSHIKTERLGENSTMKIKKIQFPNSLGRIARNYAEIVPFHKISTPGH